MVTTRYIWDIDTLRKGFAIHRKTQRFAKLLSLIALAFLAWGAYTAVTSKQWISGLPLILLGVFLLVGARQLAVRQFSRAVRRSPTFGSEMTYTFDPDQIVNFGKGYHSTFTWKRLYSATVTDHGVLLYTNKNLFHWIPVTGFAGPSDMATVQTYLRENGVRTQKV